MHNFLFDGEFPRCYRVFFCLSIFLGNKARGVTIEDKEQANMDILTWVSKLHAKIRDAIERQCALSFSWSWFTKKPYHKCGKGGGTRKWLVLFFR